MRATARALLLALLVAPSLAACGSAAPAQRADAESAQAVDRAGAAAASALAAFSEPQELARFAAGLYRNRRVFAGATTEGRGGSQAAMADAARAVWSPARFAEAGRAVAPPPADVQMALARFARALTDVRQGRAPPDGADPAKVGEADAARALPARFGPEVTLLLQRMIAGYAAVDEGRLAGADPARLAREIVQAGRAAAAGGGDEETRRTLAMIEQASGGAYWSRQALAAMPADDARRLVAWTASPEGRAHADALLAAWAKANDEAGEEMLVRFFRSAAQPVAIRPAA